MKRQPKFSPILNTLLLISLVVGFVDAHWDEHVLSEIGVTDQDISKFLDEQESRDLQEEKTGDRKIFERCGRRNKCAASLECMNAFLFTKRCVPRQCLQNQLADFKSEINMQEYLNSVLEKAKLKEDGLINAYAESDEKGIQFYESQEFQTLWAIIEANPEPRDRIAEIFKTCFIDSSDSKDATEQGHSFYYGLHVEVGAGGEYQFNWFQGSRFVDITSGKRSYFYRHGGGIALGGGIGVTFIAGYALTGHIDDIIGCSFMGDADAGVGIGAGFAIGTTFDNVLQTELTLGPGELGVEAAGSSILQTSKIYPPAPTPTP